MGQYLFPELTYFILLSHASKIHARTYKKYKN